MKSSKLKLNNHNLTLKVFIISISIILINAIQHVFGFQYDTDHFADTFFLLGAAWRVHEGLIPVIDFGHFYGGFVSESLGWTMFIFGTHTSVFYVYSIILSIVLLVCAYLFSKDEISPLGLSCFALSIFTLLMTRYPLELNDPIIRITSTHSFFYNRFAQAAMLTVSLFIFFRANSDNKEVFFGVISGLIIAAVCLTKSTFIVVLPGIIIALLISCRWFAVAGTLIGLAVFVIIFDPSLQRFFGSLSYALSHVGEENGVIGLIRKSIQIPLYQPIALCATLIALAICFNQKAVRLSLLSSIVFACSVIGMTATMGGNGSLGQLALPTLIALCVGCAELARKHLVEGAPIVQSISLILVLAFALPHVANMAGAALEGYARQSQRLIHDGPYDRYLSIPENRRNSDQATQYEMLAEGMTVLRSLGDSSEWGIIADAGITFEHPLLSKPVAGYPLWQRVTAPEFGPDRALSEEIEIILLSRGREAPVGDIIRSKMTDVFSICARSENWEVYAHQRLALTTCDPS